MCRTPRDADVLVPRTRFLQLQARHDRVTPFRAAGSASCLPKKNGDVRATDGLLLLTRTSGAQTALALAQRTKSLRESITRILRMEMVRPTSSGFLLSFPLVRLDTDSSSEDMRLGRNCVGFGAYRWARPIRRCVFLLAIWLQGCCGCFVGRLACSRVVGEQRATNQTT